MSISTQTLEISESDQSQANVSSSPNVESEISGKRKTRFVPTINFGNSSGEPRLNLVGCKECGHQISRKADMCPHCGHTKKLKKVLIRVGLFAVAFAFVVYHEAIIEFFNMPEIVEMMLHHLLGIPMDECPNHVAS